MTLNQYSDEAQIDRLARSLTNISPTDEQVARIERMRARARSLGETIILCCPSSANRTHAIRQLEDALMWAVKSILLDDDGRERTQEQSL
jgi:hypothetical protein